MFHWVLVFLLGAASGSMIEHVYHALKRLPPIRGLFHPIPLKPIYGLGAILAALVAPPLRLLPLPLEWLALSVLLGAYEIAGGVISERFLKRRLWKYEPSFLNVRGYSDAFHAGAWGALGLTFAYYLDPVLAMF